MMHAHTNQDDINRIIHSDHWDPYTVLGMHELDTKLIIRAFLPRAVKAWVVDVSGKEEFPMERIADEGFYVCEISGKKWFSYRLKLENREGHSWEIIDPYGLPPVISDFDMHLFSEGNNHRAYEILGAHLMEHGGLPGVHFAVWAPNAKRVSVVGNFNHWDGRENPMRTRGNCGIWETFIPGLVQGEIYKYEIKGQSGQLLQKADPYGFAAELRPKTGSVVWDVNSYTWSKEDAVWLAERDEQDTFQGPVSIYEVHLGSWMRTEDNTFLSYPDLADKLAAYVIRLGFTHVELLPVSEHPLDASWGYQVTGYFAPTSRFGSPDDFKAFVEVMHQNGIGVIIDWVPAHFPVDAHGLAGFDGTALYEHSDPRKGFHQDWQTLIFNYGRNEVRNFLISNALFWLDKYHIDGLRVDAVASMLYLDYARNEGEWIPNEYGGNENLEAVSFIKQLNEVLFSYHRGILTIAEESTSWPAVSRPTYLGGLGFNLKWNMGWMNDFLEYVEKEPIYRKYHHNNLTFALIYAFHENFTLVISHDEVVHGKESLISKMPGDDWQKFANVRLAVGYMYAHPGKKLLFQGCEFGQWGEWNFNQSIDWHLTQWEPHSQLQRFIEDLNKLYRNYPALYELDFEPHGFEWIDFHDWEGSIVSFIRRGRNPEDVVVAVCNFTPVVRHSYRIGVPLHTDWEEVLNSDAAIYGGGNIGNMGGYWSDELSWQGQPCSICLTLPPLTVMIFAPRKVLAVEVEEVKVEKEKEPVKKTAARKTSKKQTAAKKTKTSS